MAAPPEVEQAQTLALAGRPYDALRLLATEETAQALGEACDRLEDEAARRRCAGVVGDAYFIQLKLDEAIDWYEPSDRPLGPVHLVAEALGRVAAVDRLAEVLGPGFETDRSFLEGRALENVRMGGDPVRGFWVDEAAIDSIALRLNEDRDELLARVVRSMVWNGSRHEVKHHLLALHSKDGRLIRETEPAFQRRADEPRAALGRRLAEALATRGGRLGEPLQRGDVEDDWNPKAAALWRGELDGRPVILKEHLRLPLDFFWADGWSEELEVLQAVTPHPQVAPLLEVLAIGRHEVLVLGVAPGEDLGRRLAREGTVPVTEARRIMKAAARAVAHLHARRVVWLDVKPENILDDGATTTLVDFGMARRLGDGSSVTSLLSTAAYVEPWMARSFFGGPEVDVFQLGLLLVELVTGRHAFAGVPITHGREEPREAQVVRYALASLWREPDLSGLPDDLRSLAASALSRDFEARPTAAAFAEAL